MKALSAFGLRAATVALALAYFGASAAPHAGHAARDYRTWLVAAQDVSDASSGDGSVALSGGGSQTRLWPRSVAVPEPGALTLLGAGFAAVLIACRRRKTQ